MRTILLLSVAAASLLLAGRATSAETPAADPAPKLDYGAPAATDARVTGGEPGRAPADVEYRHVDGAYDAEGRWTGTWTGTYEAPDGRRYDGSYEGTVEGHPGAGYPPPPFHDAYDYDGGPDPRDADMYRRCGRGGQVGGAVAGGVLGGIVGNRVAGHGDRTEGTVIGGALGAVAGAAIGDAADRQKCEEWRTGHGVHRRYRYDGHRPDGYAYGYPGATTVYQQGGYGYGYGWYTPGVVVTTYITNGAPLVTETVETTTKTYYEDAPVRKRYAPRKKAAPRPKAKPRCAC